MTSSDATRCTPSALPLPPELAGLPLDAFPQGITVADGQGRILQTNAAATQLLGLSASEQKARSIHSPEWRLFRPDGSALAVENFPGLRALRERTRIEEPELGVLRPDGSLIWLSIVAVPLEPDRVLITYGDVSEARRVREALQESEIQNHALISAIPDLIFTNRRDGLYLAFHAGNATELLLPPEAFLQRNIRDVLPRPLADQYLAAIAEALDSQAVQELEYELPIGGEERQFEARVAPCTEDTVITLVRDVTERKRSEAEVRASRQQYENLVTSIPVGIYVIRSKPDGTIAFEFVSPRMAHLLGMDRDQLLADIQAAFRAVHPEDSEAFVQLNLEDLRLTVPFDWTGRFIIGGAVRWLHIEATPRTLEDGDVLWHGVVTDVTERRQTEAALRENEAQLRVIFEATGAGIILVSPQGEVRFANRHMTEMFGLTNQVLMGTQYPELLHPSEREIGDERMRQLIKGQLQQVSQERRYLRADGTDFWGHLSGRRLDHADGSLLALVGIITDISQRKQAEEAQAKLQAQLNQAQKMESLGSLAGGVAHDMNNVLGAILGLATAHIEVQPPGSPAHRAFETIIKAAERGGTLLRSLLSFARHGTAEMRDLDLNTIIREEVHLLERTTLAKIRLVMDLAPELRSMHGDASALTHVFMNLCVNAVDAMPGSGTLTLRTRNRDDRWIEVQVEDTGIGMTEETLAKAMDPFFTTKDVGKGTGLGLSIVYSTVQAHHGTIELRSQPEQGSCVTIAFPVSGQNLGNPQASGKHATMASRKALDILLVDDDELIQSSMQAILEVLKHHVTLASSGEEALAKLQAGLVPDVIILDMNMPGMGGAGALPRLRALLPTVPILLATGRADQTALDLVEAHPGVTLLAKPFGMKELQKHLEPLGT